MPSSPLSCFEVAWNRKINAHAEIELIRPLSDYFVFGCLVSDLVLVDLVASGSVSVLVEEHWVSSYA